MKRPNRRAIDTQINAIYCRACSGVQINVMDISKIMDVGRRAIAAGDDPEPAIVAFVQTIRQN